MSFLINPYVYGSIVFQVKTDNAGTSTSTQFTLPLRPGGTYNYTINWGDGTVETFTDATNRTHDYGVAGTYTATITGTFLGYFHFNNTGDKAKIVKVLNSTLPVGNTLTNAYHACTSLTTANVSNWDTSNVTSFNGFAQTCSSLTSLDVSNWNTSNVTNFNYFVVNCTSLTTLDVSNWDTSKVTNFLGFAQACSSLTSLDVSNWNTSNVTNFGYFVVNCTSLTTLDVSNWDTSKVTNFDNFASNCNSLTTITVGNAFDNSPCTNYTGAFSGCKLNQASVDAILVSINTANTSNGTLTMSAGTNATPSVTGQGAADALRARGWTVTLNGY